MGAIKSFTVGVMRIAAIILLVIVSLAALGFGGASLWNNWTESQEAARNAPLEETTEWPPITLEPLGDVELSLTTKWRDGRLLYQFNVDGYTPEIAAAKDAGNADSEWALRFLDEDGFETASVAVPVSGMTKSVIDQGKYGGLSTNSNTLMSADEYRRAVTWSIAWSGFPEPKPPAPIAAVSMPPQAPVAAASKPRPSPPVAKPRPSSPMVRSKSDGPKWRDIKQWRQLNRQMSKAQVTQLLGEPGRVVDTGGSVLWYWDYPSGGQVTFKADGSIRSYSEP